MSAAQDSRQEYQNLNPKKDITSVADIELMVNTFYGRIRNHSLLGDIFNGVIQDRWPEHLQKMVGFWQTILLGEHRYQGSPFPPHAKLPIEKQHFEAWYQLFREVVEELFEGEKATEAKWRAAKMAELFQIKMSSSVKWVS